MREPELWEYVDGLIHFQKEIFGIGLLSKEGCLSDLTDFMCLNYNKPYMTNMCKKTVWECFTQMFSTLDKSEIDFHFDYLEKIVVKEIQGNNY
jgi:hypothetical protein